MTDPEHRHAHGRNLAGAPDLRSPALGVAQRSGLVAMVVLVSGLVMAWNALTGHRAVAPGFDGGLDPVTIARSSLDMSALHWIAIRRGGDGPDVDFAPLLTDAAALASVRYGLDRSVPDQTLDLPADRHLWPLPPRLFGLHVLRLPADARIVSVSITYLDGTHSPVLVYPVPPDAP